MGVGGDEKIGDELRARPALAAILRERAAGEKRSEGLEGFVSGAEFGEGFFESALAFENGREFGEDNVANDELAFATGGDKDIHPGICVRCACENGVESGAVEGGFHFLRGAGPRV